MGYFFAMGECVACHRLISFNPDRVPSLTVNGHREPLCQNCFDRWNTIHRTSKGLPPVPLDPEAYQPQNENQV